MTWERARQPEQIQTRRRAILAAAAEVYEAEGLDGTSLSEIARRSGVSKASVYRYFESREQIFLHLLLDDQTAWLTALEAALAPLAGKGDVDGVADAIADTTLAHPRYAALSSALASVLERNVSSDVLRGFKRAFIAGALRLRNAVQVAIPALAPEVAHRFVAYHIIFGQGLHASAHPPPALLALKSEPEFAAVAIDERDFYRDHARRLLRGMLAEA